MGLFGKLFTKRVDPDAEPTTQPFEKLIEQAINQSKKLSPAAYRTPMLETNKLLNKLKLLVLLVSAMGFEPMTL